MNILILNKSVKGSGKMEISDSFKIMKNTKNLVYDVSKLSKNIPKNEVILKNNLQQELFSLIRLLNSYIVNNNQVRIKEKNLKDFIIGLSMVNFYFEYAFQNKIISYQKFQYLIEQVSIIRKLAYGVLKSEKVRFAI